MELLGRGDEIERILAVAQTVRDGRPAIVAINGEAGIGKSSLLGEVVVELGQQGFTVLSTALSDAETHISWAGLRLLCSGTAADQWALLPEGLRDAIPAALGRTGDGHVDSSKVAFALAELLQLRATEAPIAVVVDDLHWLDASTAGALAFAVRSSTSSPLLLLVAHRPIDLPLEPHRLLPADQVHTLELPGLSVAGIHQLITAGGVSIDRSDAVRIHATTAGHPLHAVEIGRLLARGVSIDDALVHPSAYSMISARIAALPVAAQEALLLAALAAEPTPARLRRAAPSLDVEAELDVAQKQQLIELRRGVVQFAHPLVRAAAIAVAGSAERRRTQLALADTAEHPDEAVSLLVAATSEPDEELAARVDAAVERAAERGDLQTARQLARRAAELTPVGAPAAKAARLLAAAELGSSMGDSQLPVELAEEAQRLDDSIDVVFRAGVVRMLTLGNAGHERRAADESDVLVDALAGHPRMQARIHDIRAQLRIRSDVAAALTEVTKAVELAEIGGDAVQIRRERALMRSLRVLAGEPVDLDEVIRDMADLDITSSAMDWLADVLSFHAYAQRSLDVSRRQLVEYQRAGLVHFEAPVRNRMIGDLINLGRYDEAIRQCNEWHDLQRMIGGTAAAPTLADMAYAHALRGERDLALECLCATQATSVSAVEVIDVQSRTCRTYVALSEWAAAVEHGIEAEQAARALGCRSVCNTRYRTDTVEALLQMNRLDEARQFAIELTALIEHSREPVGTPEVDRAWALIEGVDGDAAVCTQLWQRAVDGYDALSLPLETARARLGLGSASRRAGRRINAGEALEAAEATFVDLGAVPYVQRTRAELERLGGRRTKDANTLTPTEEQVAKLVAEGLTNAEIATTLFMSAKTVESHLTRIYRKLTVRSRTELARKLNPPTR